jgi:flagellar biogenesis protein FliO
MKIETMNIEAKTMEISTRAGAALKRILRLNRCQPRRLHLCESLGLGERRFVAVVEFEGSRFLLGGTAGSLALLARLESSSQPAAEAEGSC